MITLTESILIDAPLERCFSLINNVQCQAFVWQSIDATPVEGKTTGQLATGDSTKWTAKLFGLLFPMTINVKQMQLNQSLILSQTEGPFKEFQQVFSVCEEAGKTRIDYSLTCESPYGVFGAMYERLLLEGRWHKSMVTRLELTRYVIEKDTEHGLATKFLTSGTSTPLSATEEKQLENAYS